MKSFWKGLVTGVVFILFVIFLIWFTRLLSNRDRELIESMEVQHELQELREDYGMRDPLEFLDEPGVRGAADDARDEYYRRLDEILQRYGGGGVD
jgi:hypothetical protein